MIPLDPVFEIPGWGVLCVIVFLELKRLLVRSHNDELQKTNYRVIEAFLFFLALGLLSGLRSRLSYVFFGLFFVIWLLLASFNTWLSIAYLKKIARYFTKQDDYADKSAVEVPNIEERAEVDEFIERFAGAISLLQWLVATACVLFVVIAAFLFERST